jgi:hypothetical protein
MFGCHSPNKPAPNKKATPILYSLFSILYSLFSILHSPFSSAPTPETEKCGNSQHK